MPPPKTKKQQEPEPQTSFTFKVDGVQYDLDLAAVPNRVQMDVARLTGMTWTQLMHLAGQTFSAGYGDFWIIAAIMYVARRVAGENPSFSQVLDSVGADTVFEFSEEDPPEV